MLASPRLHSSTWQIFLEKCFNPTQDACFPTTLQKQPLRQILGCFNPTQDACFPTTLSNLFPIHASIRFNPTQGACFPTTSVAGLLFTGYVNVSILLRMLASPRLASGVLGQLGPVGFQSYSGCLLPHDRHSESRLL